MENNWEININIQFLTNYKLTLEQYLILYAVANNNKEIISSYTKHCNKINNQAFADLENREYLKIDRNGSSEIYFENLSLAKNGQSLRGTVIPKLSSNPKKLPKDELEKQFGEFREIYPSSVKRGNVVRRLQGNLKRCRELYEKLLMETSHDILCKAARLYINEKVRSNSEMYIQEMQTWLNQRNYQQYLEDIEKEVNFTAGKTSFTDDI